jgi:hypothetical protein
VGFSRGFSLGQFEQRIEYLLSMLVSTKGKRRRNKGVFNLTHCKHQLVRLLLGHIIPKLTFYQEEMGVPAMKPFTIPKPSKPYLFQERSASKRGCA